MTEESSAELNLDDEKNEGEDAWEPDTASRLEPPPPPPEIKHSPISTMNFRPVVLVVAGIERVDDFPNRSLHY